MNPEHKILTILHLNPNMNPRRRLIVDLIVNVIIKYTIIARLKVGQWIFCFHKHCNLCLECYKKTLKLFTPNLQFLAFLPNVIQGYHCILQGSDLIREGGDINIHVLMPCPTNIF